MCYFFFETNLVWLPHVPVVLEVSVGYAVKDVGGHVAGADDVHADLDKYRTWSLSFVVFETF